MNDQHFRELNDSVDQCLLLHRDMSAAIQALEDWQALNRIAACPYAVAILSDILQLCPALAELPAITELTYQLCTLAGIPQDRLTAQTVQALRANLKW